MRLIDADALPRLTQIFEANGKRREQEVVLSKIIDNAPTIDAYGEGYKQGRFDAEADMDYLVRRGHWEVIDEAEPRRFGCSICRRLSWYMDNYCPNCGAHMMDEGEKI